MLAIKCRYQWCQCYKCPCEPTTKMKTGGDKTIYRKVKHNCLRQCCYYEKTLCKTLVIMLGRGSIIWAETIGPTYLTLLPSRYIFPFLNFELYKIFTKCDCFDRFFQPRHLFFFLKEFSQGSWLASESLWESFKFIIKLSIFQQYIGLKWKKKVFIGQN